MHTVRFRSVLAAVGGAVAIYLVSLLMAAHWFERMVYLNDLFAAVFGLLLFFSITFGWLCVFLLLRLKLLWMAGCYLTAFVVVALVLLGHGWLSTAIDDRFYSNASRSILFFVIPLGGALSAVLMEFRDAYRERWQAGF